MSEEIKRMDIKEFRELGFIQEINRRVLHPCGLALEVIIDEEGNETLGGVWDYREEPEGMRYSEGTISVDKVMSVETLFRRKQQLREDALGYFVQPATDTSEE